MIDYFELPELPIEINIPKLRIKTTQLNDPWGAQELQIYRLNRFHQRCAHCTSKSTIKDYRIIYFPKGDTAGRVVAYDNTGQYNSRVFDHIPLSQI